MVAAAVVVKKVAIEAQTEHFLVSGFIMPFLDFYCGSEDHLGSTRMVLDEDGGIKEALMYQPYGTVSDVEGMRAPVPDPLREKFTGKEYDEDGDGNGASGIQAYHFGFRVYDPEVGIWLAKDPMNQYWNTYSYGGGNPINGIDPSGAKFNDIDEGQSYEDEYASWLEDMSLNGSMFQNSETATFETMETSEGEFSWADFESAVAAINDYYNPVNDADEITADNSSERPSTMNNTNSTKNGLSPVFVNMQSPQYQLGEKLYEQSYEMMGIKITQNGWIGVAAGTIPFNPWPPQIGVSLNGNGFKAGFSDSWRFMSKISWSLNAAKRGSLSQKNTHSLTLEGCDVCEFGTAAAILGGAVLYYYSGGTIQPAPAGAY